MDSEGNHQRQQHLDADDQVILAELLLRQIPGVERNKQQINELRQDRGAEIYGAAGQHFPVIGWHGLSLYFPQASFRLTICHRFRSNRPRSPLS